MELDDDPQTVETNSVAGDLKPASCCLMHVIVCFERHAKNSKKCMLVVQRDFYDEFLERMQEVPSKPRRDKIRDLPHRPVPNLKGPEKVRVMIVGAITFQSLLQSDRRLQELDLQLICGKAMKYISLIWWLDDNLDMDVTEGCLIVHSFGAVSPRFCVVCILRQAPVKYKLCNRMSTDSGIIVDYIYTVAVEIDPGRTYSSVGVLQHGKVKDIVNDHDNRTALSYMAFIVSERLIGEAAKSQVAVNLTNRVFDVNRLTGRRFGNSFVQSDWDQCPFEIISNNDKPKICVEYEDKRKTFSQKKISPIVRVKMKEIAVVHLGRAVSGAVVTACSCFNDSQRQTTKNAVAIVRLNVLRIVSQPTAAVTTYDLDKIGCERNVMMFGLGGGIFHVPILTIEDGMFEVKATDSTHLGGERFGNRMVEHSVQELKRKHKDVASNTRALRRLHTACERAARTLSSGAQANLEIDSLYEGMDLCTSVTRDLFVESNVELFQSRLSFVEKEPRDTKIDNNQVHEMELVGGSTSTPKVHDLLNGLFSGKALNESINLDKAFAYEAAARDAMLSADRSEDEEDMVLLDAILSLGLEMANGMMTAQTKRNTATPAKQIQTFTTYSDNQLSGLSQLYEGERAITRDKKSLGKFKPSSIPPASFGFPQNQVIFDIDAFGMLNTSAADEARPVISRSALIKRDVRQLSFLEREGIGR
ncbi:unnamed protein product [Calicophoron daubneyi]|uniref:Uncharacterized protein n=1 Tax=Calicophoron daubneyi TaxID=300641 RepID=A0AAV2T7S8_CALDB